eukprot:Protomagalhaensia_sp_Gyna_25__5631@NODE_788_length_2616_cov_25_672099_g619_i0_p1_GENE_NODE_788_length_2616_cov_25_672099_g619_i0NODE_788_length_2616_cov_25_672099_g619_i0_p1_ORF_typecomplete_len618_score156_75DUF4139/PF13598_6/1_9e37DUF4140/PF13600_6/0_41_NODE_788_length_2616_cov_25_672099_g619_i07022555
MSKAETIEAPVVEACVFQRRNDGEGVEVTRLVGFPQLSPGIHTIQVPLEQVVKACEVKIEQQQDVVQVLSIKHHIVSESFKEKANRSERGSRLYTRLTDCARSQAKWRLAWAHATALRSSLVDVTQTVPTNGMLAKPKASDYLALLEGAHDFGLSSLEVLQSKASKAQNQLDGLKGEVTRLIEELNAMGSQPVVPFSELFKGLCNMEVQDALAAYEEILSGAALNSHAARQCFLSLSLEVPKPILEETLKLKYSVGDGHWVPSYEVRFASSDLTKLEIWYYASVKQYTQEDWADLKLRVSTARLSSSLSPPSLGVCVARPQEAKVFQAATRMMRAPAGGTFGTAAPQSPAPLKLCKSRSAREARITASPLEESSMQAAFEMPGKVSLASDNRHGTQFLLGTFKIPMKTAYYSCPEISGTIFRASRLKNDSSYHLVPSSQCQVVCDGSRLTKSHMPAVAPGDSFNFMMGEAERMKLKVHAAKTWTKSGVQMLGQNDKIHYERTVTISSFEPGVSMVLLAFNLPESQDTQIKCYVDPSKIQSSITEISAPDDIALLDSPRFPSPSTGSIKWIYNPVTHNCLCVAMLEPSTSQKVTFATILEVPNGRTVEMKVLPVATKS